MMLTTSGPLRILRQHHACRVSDRVNETSVTMEYFYNTFYVRFNVRRSVPYYDETAGQTFYPNRTRAMNWKFDSGIDAMAKYEGLVSLINNKSNKRPESFTRSSKVKCVKFPVRC